ncbi:MAG TPA: glycosyltransferase family 39 protein [Candidatus Omnitrophota bacterium]|nr:glycosyltransferase family 39 protein [Candidatus Omnitrophota bacterium]HPS20924.1 glycosyltransferase family 39 protein [Candidatus Omnitrophota bacterium]
MKYFDLLGARKNDIISYLLLAVIVLGAFLFGQKAIQNEKRLSFDEHLYTVLADQLSRDPFDYSPRPFWKEAEPAMKDNQDKVIAKGYLDVPLFKHPPLFSYLVAISQKMTSGNAISGKYMTLFFRLGLIVVVFFSCKAIWGSWWGILAAFFTGIEPVYTFCSQKIWIEGPCTFFIYLGIFFAILWQTSGRDRHLIISAVSLGLALLCKYSAVPGVIAACAFLMLSGKMKDKTRFLAYCALPFAVFSPWLIWNYAVFGPAFIQKIIGLNTSAVSGIGPSSGYIAGLVGGAATAVIAIIAVYFLRHKKQAAYPNEIYEKYFKYLKNALGIFAALILAFSIGNIVNALNIRWYPPVSSSMHMYDNKPVIFAFSHLIEISPLYILSFCSLFFLKDRKNAINVFLLLIAVTFVLFGKYASGEIRYITIATPAFMILAVYTIKEMVSYITSQNEKTRGYVIFLLVFFLAYAVIKTIGFDLSYIIRNDFIFL